MSERRRGTATVDSEFLRDLQTWQELLILAAASDVILGVQTFGLGVISSLQFMVFSFTHPGSRDVVWVGM